VFGGEWDPGRISTLYRNVGKSGSWLTVDVRDGERAALGARVSVFRSGRAGVASARLFTGEVQAGNGFASSRRALVHAGLGTVGVVDVVIEPPFGGAPVVIVGQRANRRIAVTLP